MSTSLFELVNRLGVRSAGRSPSWTRQEDTTGAPTTASAGVNIRDALKTLIHVSLREEAHRRTARVEPEYDSDTVYRVTIDGNDVDTNTDEGTIGDLDALLAEIRDNLNGDATVGDIVTASVEDDQVKIVGQDEADYTIETSIVSGAGTIDHTADATQASARVWLYDGGRGDRPRKWVLAADSDFGDLGYRGVTERITTSGYSRIYVEVHGEDGGTAVSIGPGGLE